MKNNLSPLTLRRGSEDPAAVVFCFNHIHAEPRDQYVINLRCAVAKPEGDMTQEVVVWRRKSRSNCSAN